MRMLPLMEQLAAEYKDEVIFLKVNAEDVYKRQDILFYAYCFSRFLQLVKRKGR